MTADALLVVQTVFSVIWRLFTSWKIPGTDTTPAAWFLFVALAVLALKFLKSFIPGFEVVQTSSGVGPVDSKQQAISSGRSLRVL